MSVAGLCMVYIPGWVWSGEVAEPIGSAYEDGTDNEFRNVGN